jgi:predicted nucleotidyltransferase component of viral defense system
MYRSASCSSGWNIEVISEGELRRAAARAALGVGQAEHEYVLLCALDALSQTPLLSETFCLKGGTALRQLYFPDWRHSVDLDFTVLPAFPAERLRAGLMAWFEQTGQIHGIQISLRSLHKANGAARARATFLGPLRHPNRLFLDVTLDEPVILQPQRRPIVATLFPDPRPQVLTYALEEILAEKLRSILQRAKARDYYDVWQLLNEKGDAFDSRTTLRVFREKCRHKGLPEASAQDLLSPIPHQAASAYWSQELIGQIPAGPLPPWTSVTADLNHLLADFFS